MGSLNLSLVVPCCKHDMWTYLVLYSVKWKYWIDPCRKNKILDYMPTSLINEMFELVPWYEIWYVNLFGFVFRKMKILEWPLSRKWDFSIYDIKFDKYEGATCPSMPLDASHNIWTYLDLNLVSRKYMDDPCHENKILAYMVSCLINKKVSLVPQCPLMQNIIRGPIWFCIGKMKVLDWPLSQKCHFGLCAYKFDKWDVWTCPLMWNMLCEPIWF